MKCETGLFPVDRALLQSQSVNTYTAASFANTNEFIKAILTKEASSLALVVVANVGCDIHRNATDATYHWRNLAKIGIGVSLCNVHCGAGNATHSHRR